MPVDKDLILKLRKASQSGFSDCKKALEACNNDLEESIKWLRQKGIAKAHDKSAFKEAKEGGTWVKKDKSGAVILELNSETDFTANSKEFSSLAESILDFALSSKPNDFEEFKKKTMSDIGSVEENCLNLSSITGEKVVLSRLKYFPLSDSESASCYRHNNGKISTLIIFNKKLNDEDINGFAVHYAANNPKFISKEEVDQDWINSEKEIIVSLLKKENKPEQFHEKIISERIKKLISQEAFLEQAYLYDTSKSVGQKISELGAEVKSATYFGLGESIRT